LEDKLETIRIRHKHFYRSQWEVLTLKRPLTYLLTVNPLEDKLETIRITHKHYSTVP